MTEEKIIGLLAVAVIVLGVITAFTAAWIAYCLKNGIRRRDKEEKT